MPVKADRSRLAVSIGLSCAIMLLGLFLFRLDSTNSRLADQSRVLLLSRAKAIKPETVPSVASFQHALAYQPLNPRLISGMIYARSGGATDGRVVAQGDAVLRRLGWRDTTAIQNRLYEAGKTRDVLGALDLIDSLLRRDQLTSEMTPLLNAIEALPEARAQIVKRLTTAPPWRESYLSNVSGLKTGPLLEARYHLLRELQGSAAKLNVAELSPSVARIANAGKVAEASELWRHHVGGTNSNSVLLDGDFARFAEPDLVAGGGVPFEWYTSTGAGFSVTPIEGVDSANVEIRWDGRRAPIFLNQIVSAKPGSYRLVVRVAESPSTAQEMLQFSADCITGGRNIFRFAKAVGRQRLEYMSDGPIECTNYRFSVRGFVAPRDLSSIQARAMPVLPTSRVTSLSGLVLIPAQ